MTQFYIVGFAIKTILGSGYTLAAAIDASAVCAMIWLESSSNRNRNRIKLMTSEACDQNCWTKDWEWQLPYIKLLSTLPKVSFAKASHQKSTACKFTAVLSC